MQSVRVDKHYCTHYAVTYIIWLLGEPQPRATHGLHSNCTLTYTQRPHQLNRGASVQLPVHLSHTLSGTGQLLYASM